MLKPKNKKIRVMALAAVVAVGTMMGSVANVNAASTPITADTPGTGETPVTYDTRNIVPDDNGQYGMVIPTSINFSDTSMEKEANLEIIGINGFELSEWTELIVTGTVTSENGAKLLNGSNSVSYKLDYAGNVMTDGSETVIGADTGYKFGVGGAAEGTTLAGKATLLEKGKVKGMYKDKLTYTFTEKANSMR